MEPLTKDELLLLLKAHMLKPKLPPNTFAKLANLYAELSGWVSDGSNKKPPSTSQPDEENVNDLVLKEEAKRKEDRLRKEANQARAKKN